MNAGHTADPTHAPAGVPSASAHTPPTAQGGPLVPFSQATPTTSGQARGERTVHDNVSRTVKSGHMAKSVLTANPNRTKAPIRQEVNR